MRPDNIEVREAETTDSAGIEIVKASAIATLRETYRPRQKAVDHKQAISATLTQLVAISDGRVIGTVQYVVMGDRLHFLSLDVDSEWRRQGVARRLIAELEESAKSAGALRLSTYTVTQTGNCEIFRRLGFTVVSEEPTDFFESVRYSELTESYLERDLT